MLKGYTKYLHNKPEKTHNKAQHHRISVIKIFKNAHKKK